MLSKKHIFFTVGIIAATARLVFYALFSGTMFRYYHMVSGLDMQTLLRFSEWGSADQTVPPFFTLHRLTIYWLWKLSGGVHHVDMIFLLQAISGIIGALAVADLTLMLCGKRKAATVAGILYALYLPFLIYEFSVLQESFSLNTLLLAVWALFYARKKRFNFFSAVVSGVLWGLALTGRPVALLTAFAALVLSFLWCRRKKLLRKWLLFPAGILLVISIATIFNAHFKSGRGPFYNVLPYTVHYNTAANADSTMTNDITASKLLTTAKKMILRIPLLLSVRELPENQNMYFWREKMPESRLLIGPEILMTLTVFSLVIFLLSGKWKSKSGLILWMLLLAPALCGREAIGRYRLMLCPYFIIITVIAISGIPQIKNLTKRRILIFTAAAVALGYTFFEMNRNHGLRLSDYHSWAIATEAAYGNNDQVLDAYFDYWQRSGMRDNKAFRAIQGAAMRSGNFEFAAHVIRQAEIAGGVSPVLISYFTGVLYVGQQNPDAVYRAFIRIKPEELPPDLQPHYHRVMQDTVNFIRQRENLRLNKTR